MSGALLRKICPSNILSHGVLQNLIHTSAEVCAARKGTREKARKKKVKVEVKKIGFIPHNERDLDRLKLSRKSRRSVDTIREEPIDKVFAAKYYKTISYSIIDAIQFHREQNHPTIRNKPNAPLNVSIELNMVAEKKTRFIDSFYRIADLPHPFGTYEERTVLAFCKTPEQVQEALDAGADLAGGTEIVQRIQSGEVSLPEFKYVISHPAMLAELVPVRGLLKKKFPQVKTGTLGPDLASMLRKFKHGLQYRAEKDPDEHDLGVITAAIGSLDMEDAHLEANLAALVQDVEAARPKRSGDFITWIWCTAAPSPERFKLNFEPYLKTSS